VVDQVWIGVFLVAALFILLGSGVWIALALMGVGWLAMELYTSTPVGKLMATSVWGASNNWSLTALPLFIWMGEILFRSRISEDMFRGLAPWMNRLPGRLLHCNVIGCGIFAAISGSSAATAATIGKMTVPELTSRGYDESMAVGSLAGAGTLGLLIPPSIIMIVYGVAAQVSIARLFIAGVIPGLLLVLLFSGYIATWALLHPRRAPPPEVEIGFGAKIYASRRLIPVVLLIALVIGSIYTGIATPTEAAVLGVVGSLVLAAATGGLNRTMFFESVMGGMRTSCMIAFILAGASFLTTAMGFTGIPSALAQWLTAQALSPIALIAALTVLFIILGCFIDGISMVVLTSAVILPSVEACGIDLLWFGIFIVLVVEMAQITPPVGFNLFVLQGLTGHNILFVARAALPFFCLLVVAVGIITVFPDLISFLPDRMLGRH
jgi:tripartite ATP-independent transporter DctM subunit